MKNAYRAKDLDVDKKEAGQRLKSLEATKVIVREEALWPQPVKIRLDGTIQHREIKRYGDTKGTRVRVVGRKRRIWSQKDVVFVCLYDSCGILQCVFPGGYVR